MKESTGKVIGWMLGIATGIAVTAGAWFVYVVIGLVTGAMSICTEPSAWWSPIYYLLALLLPVIGAWAGFRAGRAFIHCVASPA